MKLPMTGTIVELDGDEMTRVLWKEIKRELLEPFVELRTEYYDLGLPNRDATDDRVTAEAAEAIRRCRVGVKCATITPNAARREEYSLKRIYPSPNATLRAMLDGTVFRTPITTPRIPCRVPGWKKPITIARHAYADLYKATELRVPGKGTATLTGSTNCIIKRNAYSDSGRTLYYPDEINRVYDMAAAKGATVLISFPTVVKTCLTVASQQVGGADEKGLISAVDTYLHGTRISIPSTYIFGREYSYNSNYHVNTAGQKLRTGLISEDIIAYLKTH